MKQTKQAIPLNNTLEKLASQGYQIADKTIFFEQAETAVRSADWRLDMVQPVKSDDQNALVIAVSSASKHLKIVFVIKENIIYLIVE